MMIHTIHFPVPALFLGIVLIGTFLPAPIRAEARAEVRAEALPISVDEILLSEPAIVPSVLEESSPDIASDGRNYLAVWTSGNETRAALLSDAGRIIGDMGGFLVSTRGASSRVAFVGSVYVITYGWGPPLFAIVSREGTGPKYVASLRDRVLNYPELLSARKSLADPEEKP